MRQAALIVLLAQMGSFVPARRARVGVVDRIFTRVGASDDLARGRSTFMVEMTETSAILHNATRRSLVVLDEIGRGTSTFDGVSIAWAVAEHLHDAIGCRTLFATHYHELQDLARERPAVRNLTVAVREVGEQVVFLRKLVQGGASRSYGIEVAKLAGLPAQVLARAREILRNLEALEVDEGGHAALARGRTRARREPRASSGCSAPAPADPAAAEVASALRGARRRRAPPARRAQPARRLEEAARAGRVPESEGGRRPAPSTYAASAVPYFLWHSAHFCGPLAAFLWHSWQRLCPLSLSTVLPKPSIAPPAVGCGRSRTSVRRASCG